EADYCMAEDYMGVSGDHEQWNKPHFGFRSASFPMTRIWPSYGDRVFERLLARDGGCQVDGVPVELMSTPQARNSRSYQGRPACAGNSTCVPICPIQAKYDATLHVNLAVRHGAELWDRT